MAHPYTSDAYNQIYYNPYTQEYGLLHRAAYVDRRIALRTSKDLINWSEPKTIMHRDLVIMIMLSKCNFTVWYLFHGRNILGSIMEV